VADGSVVTCGDDGLLAPVELTSIYGISVSDVVDDGSVGLRAEERDFVLVG